MAEAVRSIRLGVVSTAKDFEELPGLKVTVERVEYHPEMKTPPDRPHCFVYFINIHNGSETPVTIRGRKWVVTNNRGEVLVVEGEGVVGQTPRLDPDESFDYNSCHLLDTGEATAEGAYFGVDDSGRRILTRIPKFRMKVPEN